MSEVHQREASRITHADIEAEITSEHYFTAYDGAKYGRVIRSEPFDSGSLKLLTFCVFVLRNGAKIVGVNYGAIDPAQHNAERGRQDARADALRQLWPLLGFRLRDKLSAAQSGSNDFALGKACDLSGDGTCETHQ